MNAAASTVTAAARARCYERFAELQAEREATQAQLADLDHARAQEDDASLLDDLPLFASTVDLHPEPIQAAPYQAFDIHALYKPDMHQVTIFATITTSTPTPSPPSSPTPATTPPTPPPPRPSPALTSPYQPAPAADSAPIYPLTLPYSAGNSPRSSSGERCDER